MKNIKSSRFIMLLKLIKFLNIKIKIRAEFDRI